MPALETRNKFSEIVLTYIQPFGFTIKHTSRGKGASGFVIFEKMLDNGTRYALQLTFTSHFEAGPYFSVTYPEIDKTIKSLDKMFAKNQGTSTLNCYFFEVLNPANTDGYLHHSAGYPYYKISEPYSSENIIKHGSSFSRELIVPVLEKILPVTDSLQKADYILNEKNPLIQGKNRLLTSVLSDPIPGQMIHSLLTANIFRRPDLRDLIAKYCEYVNKTNTTGNAYYSLLEKVINSLKSNENC